MGQPSEGVGELVLVLTPQPGSRHRGPILPQVTINGWPVREAHWGTTVLTSPAGTHRIEVSTGLFRDRSPATLDAEVRTGERTVVHYTGPWTVWDRGSLGYTPQHSRVDKVWVMSAIVGGIALLMVLIVLLVTALTGS